MKYIITFPAWLILFFGVAHSQQSVPQKFSYQAVAVDGNGAILESTPLCIRATILSGSINGTQEWIEVHPDVTTDDFGLFTIEIGAGDPVGGAQGDFADMRWGEYKHYLKIEMGLDVNCTNFLLIGTNQLLSVPYALYAERARVADVAVTATYADTTLFSYNTVNNFNDDDSDPENEIQDLVLSGTTLNISGSTAPGINLTQFNVADPDADPTNEIQDLVLNGTTLNISGSSAPGINLTQFNVADPDADPTNEIQNLVLNGTTLTITGSSAPGINLTQFNVADPDADPTNEIQNLIISGNTLNLTNSTGPGVNISQLNAFDPDTDPTNELQNLMLTGTTLTITGSTGPGINLTDFNMADPDSDPTNEIQNLVLNGSTLTITGSTGPGINLSAFNMADPDADPTNELQNLVLNGTTLTISGSTAPGINLSAFNVADPDSDPTNEIQNLVLNGTTLNISGSTAPGIDLTAFNVADPDSDPTNELQDLIVTDSTIYVSGSDSAPINLTILNNMDPDHDPTNELQNLVVTGNTLNVTNSSGPGININQLNAFDPDHDPTNEIQELTFDSLANILGLTNSSVSINLGTLSNFNASGSDLDFPQGIANAKFIFLPDSYTVPNDSVLYIVSSEDEMIFEGVGFEFGEHLTGPNLPVIKPGTQVDNCRCIGFLKEMDPFFEPVMAVLVPGQGNFYQVPFNKNFVIKSGLDEATPITLNGFTVNPFSSVIKALVIPEGIQIKNLGNDEIILTGYLITK